MSATFKSIIRINAEKDTNYCPYCLSCKGLVRMRKVKFLLWTCKCGAIHDERYDQSIENDNK